MIEEMWWILGKDYLLILIDKKTSIIYTKSTIIIKDYPI